MTDIQTTSTIQVNAALSYLNRTSSYWSIDLKSCRFFADLLTKKRTI